MSGSTDDENIDRLVIVYLRPSGFKAAAWLLLSVGFLLLIEADLSAMRAVLGFRISIGVWMLGCLLGAAASLCKGAVSLGQWAGPEYMHPIASTIIRTVTALVAVLGTLYLLFLAFLALIAATVVPRDEFSALAAPVLTWM